MKRFLPLLLFALIGCAVSKPTINIAYSSGVMVDASGRTLSASTMAHADAETSGTATVEGNQGSGGAADWLSRIWSYVIGWFGIGGTAK